MTPLKMSVLTNLTDSCFPLLLMYKSLSFYFNVLSELNRCFIASSHKPRCKSLTVLINFYGDGGRSGQIELIRPRRTEISSGETRKKEGRSCSIYKTSHWQQLFFPDDFNFVNLKFVFLFSHRDYHCFKINKPINMKK